MLSKQDIQFAFIKATEGSSFQDPLFKQKGKETFIDLNVFNGNKAEFERY